MEELQRPKQWSLCASLASALLCACHAPSDEGQAEHTQPTAAAESALTVAFSPQELARLLTSSPLPGPPADTTNRVFEDPAAARLGQWIFYDKRFSGDGRTSCASCHDPAQGWSDGRPTAQVMQAAEGSLLRHTPTLWNVAYQRWLFWDGRADSLWAQALGPLENPLEHGGSRLQYAHLLFADPPLKEAYEALFGALPDLADSARFPAKGLPDPELDEEENPNGRLPGGGHQHAPAAGKSPQLKVLPQHAAWNSMLPEDRRAISRVFANIGKSIAAFERRLLSRNAPFDEFVEGLREHDERKLAALRPVAQRGLQLFLGKARCHICHNGPWFSDREFHDVRVAPRGGGRASDAGRQGGLSRVRSDPFNGLGEFSDDTQGAAELELGYLPHHAHGWGEFKTPGLRNVAVSAPYMHQGQFRTLRDVLGHYSTFEGALTQPPPVERILQPLNLSEEEIDELLAFLESLTDTAIDPELLRSPPSPFSR